MKKILFFIYGLLIIFYSKSQQTTVFNYTSCPGNTSTIVAQNFGNLNSPSYSLNPGAIASSNPTFIVNPSINNSFTVYVSGLNSQSVTTTNQVIYNYSVTPATTLITQIAPISCSDLSATINATVNNWSASQASLNWYPSPFTLNSSSTQATYLLVAPITISLTSTDNLGCVHTVTAGLVIQQLPYFTINNITGSSSITCVNPSVHLSVSSTYTFNGGNLNYLWTNNTSTLTGFNVTITNPGNYTVLATEPISNCTTSQPLTIGINTTVPNSILTPTFQNITCNLTTVTSVSAVPTPTSNITHKFMSPFGGTLSVNFITAVYPPMTAGIYTHCLVNNVNGCSTCKNFTVNSTSGFPTYSVTSPQNFSLGCSTKSVVGVYIINGATVPPNGAISYTLLSPGNSTNLTTGILSSISAYTINTPGNYTLVSRDNTTQCESRVPVTILMNVTPPNVNVTSPSAIITCTQTQVKLEGTSTTPNVTYNWLFVPSGNVASSTINVVGLPASPSTSLIGNYTLTVKDTVNFCKNSAIATVYQNIFPPKAKISSPNSTLTCNTSSIILTNFSTSGTPPNSIFPINYPIVGYNWLGPNPQQSINYSTIYLAFVPGIYTLTVLDLNNGCTSVTTAPVYDSRIFPSIMSQDPIFLPCPGVVTINPFINGSIGPYVYLWATPANATVSAISTSSLMTNSPGDYTLSVTNVSTNCTATEVFHVYACVGLSSNSSVGSVRLFPNPNNGVFTIASEGFQKTTSIEIYNSIGILVKKQMLNSDKTILNIEREAAGIYIIHLIQNNTSIHTSKIVKE